MQPDEPHPGRHPEPPHDLASRELPILVRNQRWYRMYRPSREPVYYGKTGRNRFDAPNEEFGVLYIGEDPFCTFVESFELPTVFKPMTPAILATRRLCILEFSRPLRLVDLTGSGLARLGADARLIAADHDIAQRWSRALWQHPSVPDGLLYRARHDPSRNSVALFDRVTPASVHELGTLAHPTQQHVLAGILNEYRFPYLDEPVSDSEGDQSKSPSSG